MKEAAPNFEISTTEYIQNILVQNQSWQQRNVGNVHLPKTKVAVNTVSPMKTGQKIEESENTTDDPISNEYDEERNDFNFEFSILKHC